MRYRTHFVNRTNQEALQLSRFFLHSRDFLVRAFALEAGRLGSILSRVQPKTLKLVSAVTLAKRSAIKCSAEDEMNRE